MVDPRDAERHRERSSKLSTIAAFSLGWVLGSVVMALLQGS